MFIHFCEYYSVYKTVYNKKLIYKPCNLYKASTSSSALNKLVLTYIYKRNNLPVHITERSLEVKNYFIDMVNNLC